MDSIQDQREAPELAAMEREERGLGLALSQSDREWIQIKIVNNKPERRDTCSKNVERARRMRVLTRENIAVGGTDFW